MDNTVPQMIVKLNLLFTLLIISTLSQSHTTITGTWDDDYLIDSKTGWISDASDRIIDGCCGSTYHGPYGLGSCCYFTLSRSFSCSINVALVSVSLQAFSCNTESGDSISVQLSSDNLTFVDRRTATGANYGISMDSALRDISPCNYWDLSYHGLYDKPVSNIFTVQIDIVLSAITASDEGIAITDLTLTCDDVPTNAPTSQISAKDGNVSAKVIIIVCLSSVMVIAVIGLVLYNKRTMGNKKRIMNKKRAMGNKTIEIPASAKYEDVAPSAPQIDMDGNVEQENVTQLQKGEGDTADNICMEGKGSINDRHSLIRQWFDEKVDLLEFNEIYYQKFIQHGFDHPALIKELEKEHLDEMGINKIGHRIKILKAAKENV